ncbi:MAG: RNA 2',3'-cyclic phosphodiesterase [Planctomycetia bacterium]|nr:RNA 2',3'-cyclic phosphodiesterase [Planctomycetia bacterium]
MLRLFVACVPSAADRALLALEGARLLRAAPALRVVAPADLHFTLAFLGPTPDDRVEGLRARLAEVAAAQRPFEVRIEGLGAFPSYQRPRVLWAGLEAGPGRSALVALARRVRRACLAAGCPPDANGTFEPHVTLGRLGTRGPGAGGPPPEALEKLLTTGTLQGTYTPELLSDLVLMVSEATSLSDKSSGNDTPSDAPSGTPSDARNERGAGDRRSATSAPGWPPPPAEGGPPAAPSRDALAQGALAGSAPASAGRSGADPSLGDESLRDQSLRDQSLRDHSLGDHATGPWPLGDRPRDLAARYRVLGAWRFGTGADGDAHG